MSKRTKTLLSIVGLLVIVSSGIVVSARRASAQAQTDKPIEQTRKNIQVLKGLRESELYRVMNFMAVSIGEECDFCHVVKGRDPKNGQRIWEWESDEKPEKQAGRRMLQMVLLINGSNKVDFTQNSVTCWTCHRGQTTTVGLPPMPLAKSGHEGLLTKSTTAPPAPAHPSVEEIFARYVQAIGGADAGGTKTLFLKGTRVASQNRNVVNEITLSFPDKLLVLTPTPQGSVKQILAGDNGWVLSGANLRTLSPTEVAETRRTLQALFGIIKVVASPGMHFAGVEKIDGREMWVVAKSTPERTVSYDFDSETGLLRRMRTVTHTPALPIPEQIDFEDYRDVDGVKLPFTLRISSIEVGNPVSTRTFSEMKLNSAVDESKFTMPATPPQPIKTPTP
jgi:hypothetical protein